MMNQEYKRILLVRTDRLGDVVLTTPAIKAIRDAYPDAYITMMVRPYTELAVKDNPYLNEVIVYDKDKKDKSIIASISFARWLKTKNFDLAIIFDPANRPHIITYLAKIPRRIGYNENFPFLLTDRIENRKDEGRKHERDYILDMLKILGIEPKDKELYIPLNEGVIRDMNELLLKNGINPQDTLVTIHPGASCPSKVWPIERFAKLADRLIEVYGVKIAVIGGYDKKAVFYVDSVRKFMQNRALFLAGGLNVLELAALLKRSALFISNDSGPVHVAAAVKTPVVDLFGRNQPGLGPRRWGALGEKDIILHKDVGCAGTCLAHNCQKGFECLSAITIDEVFSAIAGMGLLQKL